MSALRLFIASMLGVWGLLALSGSASAKGGDNWLSEQAFERAGGGNNGYYSGRRRSRDDFFGFPSFFGDWRYDQPNYSRLRRNYDSYDPEPDFSIVRGKRTSPDDGFDTYVPPKLVPLTAALPDAPKPAQALASSILYVLQKTSDAASVSALQRDAIVKFYSESGFQPIWVTSEGLNSRAEIVLSVLRHAEEEGLLPSDYLPPMLGSFTDKASALRGDVLALAKLELSTTAMVLRYAENLYSGRIIPDKMSGYYDITPPQLDMVQALRELSLGPDAKAYLSSLEPSQPAYKALKNALAQFHAKSVQSHQVIVPAGDRVKQGGSDPRVPLIKKRLIELSLLAEADESQSTKNENILDSHTSKALKEFQRANKIKATGQLDKATTELLNQNAEEASLEKIVLNMERMRWLPRNLGERYIFVNQAAFQLQLVNGDHIDWSTKVIVGKPDTQTPVFSDEMETVVINPYWSVPQSIIRYEMMPYLARNPYYLDRKGFEVLNARGHKISSGSVNWWAYSERIPFQVRQPPGKSNALGNVKFLFPNSHDIYMHDTPAKELFTEQVRAFSHGCVRVENPRELATQVLDWSRERVDSMISDGRSQEVPLPQHIPVYLNYFTAWPDASGKINYFHDVYGRDARLERALGSITVAAN